MQPLSRLPSSLRGSSASLSHFFHSRATSLYIHTHLSFLLSFLSPEEEGSSLAFPSSHAREKHRAKPDAVDDFVLSLSLVKIFPLRFMYDKCDANRKLSRSHVDTPRAIFSEGDQKKCRVRPTWRRFSVIVWRIKKEIETERIIIKAERPSDFTFR